MPDSPNILREYVHEYRKRLGATIQQKRVEANITRDELGCNLGVTINTIKKIETGSYGISIDYYIKAAILLNLKVSLT